MSNDRNMRPHPWHGVPVREAGAGADEVTVYVEITPQDKIKYELDKDSGLLKIDRPQKFSNFMPCLYGLVPRTYCAESVAAFTNEQTGRNLEGDCDPLDICVLTEFPIDQRDILVNAKVIGGYRMIDGGEADDKIVAVLKDDPLYGQYNDISELPTALVERLRHYFVTYKEVPVTEGTPKVEIESVYGKEVAIKVVELSSQDYQKHYS